MHAAVGDVIVVEGQHVGHRRRTGAIREVRGERGGPPYLVRWEGDDGDCLVYPGSDAHVRRGPETVDTRPL
jgi:hypothetical protein